MRIASFVVTVLILWGHVSDELRAEVRSADAHGFSIEIERKTKASVDEIDRAIVKEIHQWWDAAHSYSGEAENLSIDLKRRCFDERLPDGGFVTHMQIAHYQPGARIRFMGGLGPLQEMGVVGALTISWEPDGDVTKIKLLYNVTGHLADGQLQELAPVVDAVLAGQLDRLANHVATRPKRGTGTERTSSDG
ncbi:MAG: hypothetical protein AAGF97_20260 [Planctomycetota bacterium]